jgi:hypothetical protein
VSPLLGFCADDDKRFAFHFLAPGKQGHRAGLIVDAHQFYIGVDLDEQLGSRLGRIFLHLARILHSLVTEKKPLR